MATGCSHAKGMPRTACVACHQRRSRTGQAERLALGGSHEETAPARTHNRGMPDPHLLADDAYWQRRLKELLRAVPAPGAVLAIQHGESVVTCAAGTANLITRCAV